MILVLLGTQNNDFHRLLDEIEKNIENGRITDKVVVQAGFTKYNSNNMKIFDITSKEILEKYVDKANLVITHAGIGSIEMALAKGKKVIAVPRKKKYKEHVNDHQKDIEKEFSKRGYLIGIDEVEDLNKALEKSKKFIPIKYELDKKNNKNMFEIIKKFIDEN